jgi:hypothetical protein
MCRFAAAALATTCIDCASLPHIEEPWVCLNCILSFADPTERGLCFQCVEVSPLAAHKQGMGSALADRQAAWQAGWLARCWMW